MNESKTRKAVALRYNQGRDPAPRVVAKGSGRIAEKILALAAENRVPIQEDLHLVQMLDALDVNTQIPTELYQAVAEVLVFVYRMNKGFHRQGA